MQLPEELQFITNGRMPQKSTDARMDGKVCVVTGATSGIGYETAKRLASGGAQLVLVCRNKEKAANVQQEIEQAYHNKVEIIQADFEKLAEVSRAATEISSRYPKVHLLINNAGIHNTGRRLTADGNEMVFQVNHLAAFLLTKKLIDNLKKGAPSRILDISSEAHRFGGLNPADLTWSKRPYIALRAYGAANIAKILTAQEFAGQLAGSGVTINVMHPGEVRTNIGMNNHIFYRLYNRYVLWWFLKDAKLAANDLYYLAAAPELEKVTGKFFNQTIEEKPASYVINDDIRNKIWGLSQELIQPYEGNNP